MTPRMKFSMIALALTCGAVPLLALARDTGSTAGLSWLAGCWQGGYGSRLIEEAWMRPRNGTLLGTARVSTAEAVRTIEFAELRTRGDSVDYITTAGGDGRVTFSGVMTGPHSFVANNPSHDFPTTVGYDLVTRDSLSAWIEGKDGAETRRIPYVYHRVECEVR